MPIADEETMAEITSEQYIESSRGHDDETKTAAAKGPKFLRGLKNQALNSFHVLYHNIID